MNYTDIENQYCELLDEQGPVKIGSLEYNASYILKNVDPTAYRCGLVDYADSVGYDEDEDNE